jgi:hypothetical protein
MDFIRLINESTLMMLSVEISTESVYWSEYFVGVDASECPMY